MFSALIRCIISNISSDTNMNTVAIMEYLGYVGLHFSGRQNFLLSFSSSFAQHANLCLEATANDCPSPTVDRIKLTKQHALMS